MRDGQVFAMLAAAGHRVAGADQSAGMLARARARGIGFSLEHTSLQDLSYAGQFNAVLTIDAMQHIPPKTGQACWPNCTGLPGRAGLLYLTVEELEQHHVERAFQSLSRTRAACGAGRTCRGDAAGYHSSRVVTRQRTGSGEQGLAILDEGFRRENGWGYRHFLLRTSPASPAS